jgi:FtsZ-interacting cell division protein ZipA
MKVRLLRQRLSVSAPRMTVRSHVPMGAQIVIGVVAIVAALVLGGWAARSEIAQTRLGDPNPQLKRIQDVKKALKEERERLIEASNTVDSNRAMERAMVKELGDQVARLEADNARLKEDVAFFEAATADRTSSAPKDANGGIAIRRFQVTEDRIAHTARYRILLTQDSKANRDFTGDLQMTVTAMQDGKAVNIAVPEETAAEPYAVVFRSYKRIDGSFVVPADAFVRSVQVRILERGVVRVQQTVTLTEP